MDYLFTPHGNIDIFKKCYSSVFTVKSLCEEIGIANHSVVVADMTFTYFGCMDTEVMKNAEPC